MDEILEQYKKLVYHVAHRKFLFMARDEDLIQHGMIGLWRAAKSYDELGAGFSTYAYRCIENAMRDYQRRTLRNKDRTLYYEEFQTMDRTLMLDSPADSINEEVDTLQAIRSAFPAGSRERYWLMALLAGMSKRDLARECGVTTGQMTRYLKRAYRKLEL
jgi:RNA polymerase sigma factor, sigma-70 family